MTSTPTNAVVVGVSGDGYDAALRYAIGEAARSGRNLHLVHVLELPAGSAYDGVYGGVVESAKALLDAAQADAEQLAGGGVRVTAELIETGWVVDDLVRTINDSSLLVLQHRALGRAHRVVAPSVVKRVVHRAHVPVVSVPEGWHSDTKPKRVVTTCVQDPVEAPALLRLGFEEAHQRGARLQVLHAWWLNSGYDSMVADSGMRAERRSEFNREVEPLLDPLRAAFSDVEALVHVQHAMPIDSVLEAAAASDLVVLGRRHHVLPLGSHLGPVAGAALDHATSPVLIAPELPVATSETRSPHVEDVVTAG